jgi:DNA-binding MarR family transcriptional regulator
VFLVIGDLDFSLRIGAISRLVSEDLEKIATSHGLAVGPASVLMAVAQSPGQTQVSYASALVVNDATLTRYIDRLENGDLVQRVRGREDRRVVRLHTTETGQRIAGAMTKSVNALEKDYSQLLQSASFSGLGESLRAFALALVNRKDRP